MHLEYSDVFSRQIGLMLGEGYNLVYDFMPMAGRRYVSVKVQGTFRLGDCILQRLMLGIDLLIIVCLMFDVDPKGLYTQNSDSDC